ncbi:hypothetical protein FRC12_021639 [Ceratobasidium sp. 428]|nr:hypothetical protein FRC12_021639 [Ceratobasidium sp. 428]
MACRDRSGKFLKIDRRSVNRHLQTDGHKKYAQTAKAAFSTPLVRKIAVPEPFDNDQHSATSQHAWAESSFDSSVDAPLYNSSIEDRSHEEEGDFDCSDSSSDSSVGTESADEDDIFIRASRAADKARLTHLPPPPCLRDATDTDDEEGWETESDDELPATLPRHHLTASKIFPTLPKSTQWSPFPSKAMYLADTLCHSRRIHFGRTHIKAALEFARLTGGEDIPTYDALRNFQKSLKARMGDPTKKYVSSQGTIFHVNEISESIKQDIANPEVRPHMKFVPHANGKHMSQAWHGRKMVHDMPDEYLTPCVRFEGRIFYVNELVRRQDDWFIPLRWITVGPEEELYAIGHRALDTPNGISVISSERKTVRVATFLESYPELHSRQAVPVFDENSTDFASMMPHPLQSTAGSRLVYSVPVIVFMDDASGNVSKQWNKHWSSYLSNAALPREELQSEYNVRFVSTSAHASPSELMQGIRASMEEAFNSPTVAFDCVLQEEVLVRPYALFWAGDNPMQAEHCSSTGMNSNHFCRTCDAGGSDDFKQSFDGYKSLFESGNMRVASETQRVINERLEMALLPKTINKCKNHARDTGVKDSMAQSTIDRLLDLGKVLRKSSKGAPRRSPIEIDSILRKELDLVRSGHYVNPLLSMPGVDIHRDTPTEILHTVLLGVVKYYWGQSVFVLEKAKKISVLECRLASANTAGLNLPKLSASYMCQYRGSLIGKHFKAIVQLMPFLCYDVLPAGLLTAWLLLGRLTSLLWYTEIHDTQLYLQELQSVIDDFLLATAEGSPSIIILKPKFHFLIHLPSYIKRFGPALLFSTERFESFNGVFRAASTFSNRHAPSRDIGKRFADLDRVKHISSGK